MKYEVRNMKSEGQRLGWWIEFLLLSAIVLLGLFAWMEDGFGQTPPIPPAEARGDQNGPGVAVFGPQQANADAVVSGPGLAQWFPECTPDSVRLRWRGEHLTALLWLSGSSDTVQVDSVLGLRQTPSENGGE